VHLSIPEDNMWGEGDPEVGTVGLQHTSTDRLTNHILNDPAINPFQFCPRQIKLSSDRIRQIALLSINAGRLALQRIRTGHGFHQHA
jgi:hypothetical protein